MSDRLTIQANTVITLPDSHFRNSSFILLFTLFWWFYLLALPSGHNSPPALILILLFLFSATLLAPFLLQTTIDPFSPVVFQMLLKALWIGKPLIQIFRGNYTNSMLPHLSQSATHDLLLESLVLIVVGQTAYLIGYFSNCHSLFHVRSSIDLPKKWSKGRTVITISVLLLVGVVTYFLLIEGVGSWSQMWRNFGRRRRIYADLKVHLAIIDIVAAPTLLLFGILAMRRGKLSKWLFLVAAGIFIVLAATGDRSRALSPLLSLCVLAHYRHKRLSMIKLFIVATLMIMAALWLQDIRKRTFHGARGDFSVIPGKEYASYDIFERFLLRKRTVDFVGVMLHLLPDRLEYQYGKTYLNAVFLPIPRKLWPGKPQIDESGLVGRALMGKRYFGLPVGSEGIFYMNFHLAGVILGMFLFGIFHKKVYLFLCNSGKNFWIILMYAVVIRNIMYTGVFNIFDTFVKLVPLILIMGFISRVNFSSVFLKTLFGKNYPHAPSASK